MSSRHDGANGTGGDPLYVGYLPETPASIARFVRRIVLLLVLTTMGFSLLLTMAQTPFDDGSFDFGNPRRVEGTVVEDPYPHLLRTDEPSTLLVAEGKHSAEREVAGRSGEAVSLLGTAIDAPLGRMLEIVSGSVEETTRDTARRDHPANLGRHRLRGEIVDSKCFLGVMKPGRGRPHRACATACLRGGIPPLFLVTSESGERLGLLLLDADGGPHGASLLPFTAEPVEIEGTVQRRGDLLYILAGLEDLRRL